MEKKIPSSEGASRKNREHCEAVSSASRRNLPLPSLFLFPLNAPLCLPIEANPLSQRAGGATISLQTFPATFLYVLVQSSRTGVAEPQSPATRAEVRSWNGKKAGFAGYVSQRWRDERGMAPLSGDGGSSPTWDADRGFTPSFFPHWGSVKIEATS